MLSMKLSYQDLEKKLQEVRKEKDHFDLILKACQGMPIDKSFNESVKYIYDICKSLIKATCGYVAFLNDDGTKDELLFLDNGAICRQVDRNRLMPIGGLRSTVYKSGKSIFENDFMNSDWVELMPSGPIRLKNVMFAPLNIGEKTLGIMGFANKPSSFTNQDKRIADTLCSIASLSLKSAQNNTELIASEEKLHDIISSMESIFRSAPTGIGVVSNRIITQVNYKLEEITGYTKKELLGQNAKIFYPSEKDFEYVGKEKYRQIQILGTGSVETKWKRKDGTIIDVLLSSTPIDYNDYAKGVTFTALNITESKNKEIELLESEEKYRSMMEAQDDPVYICSSDFKIEYLNPAMGKWIGRNAVGEICHKALFDFDEKCPWCSHGKIMDGQSVVSEVCPPRSKKTYHVAHFPIQHTDGSISKMTIYRDISEVKSLTARLQQAQKMESIGTLAGGIAHDFNNILSPIIGYTEMILDDLPEKSPLNKSLSEVYSASMRAKELVKQILTFSRQSASEQMLMKIQPIVKEALMLIRSTIPTTIYIKQDIRPDCRMIKADPTQIHQIIMNLTTNAFHAMEKSGGEMRVGLKEINLHELDIIDIEMKPGNYACLSVGDTGTGIPEDIKEKIFDPFFTTKTEGKGTGMGLSVVHGIIKSTGGGIQVYSEPGKGTEFKVYIPIAESYSEIQKKPQKELIQGGFEKILLVDDEEPIIKMEKQMLERLGYQVTSRSSSLEGLEAFRVNPDKFDLIITDFAMPNMAGDKLANEMKKIRPDIPVLLCTGFSEIMSEEKALSSGIAGFLMKPMVISDLSKKIRDVLDESKGKTQD